MLIGKRQDLGLPRGIPECTSPFDSWRAAHASSGLRAVAYLLHAAVERSIKAGEGEAAANFLQLAAPALEAQSRWLVPRPGHLATSWFGLREGAERLAQRIGFLLAHPL